MPISELKLIKNCVEFRHKKEVNNLPGYTRGIYVLFKYRPIQDKYDVVYIGMAAAEKAGIRVRLKKHKYQKEGLWTHFSAFEVWDNIREDEVAELEGLFRHIYRRDNRANKLNKQKGFKKLSNVRRASEKAGWIKGDGKREKDE